MRACCLIPLSIGIVVVITIIIVSWPAAAIPDPLNLTNLRVQPFNGISTVTGIAVNKSAKTITYSDYTFTFYDAVHAIIDTCDVGVTQAIPPQQSAEFTQYCSGKDALATNYNIKYVSAIQQ